MLATVVSAACGGRSAGIPPLPPPPHPAIQGPAVDRIRHAGFIRVASDLSNRPLEFRDGGTPRGFEMDLAALLANALGVRLEVIDTPMALIQAGFPRGADMMLSALAPDYPAGLHSDPYYVMGQAILSPQGAPVTAPEQLRGLRVAAQTGSAGAAIATQAEARSVLLTYLPDQALSAVGAGRADAAVGDLPRVIDFAQSHPGLRVASGGWREVPLVAVVRSDMPDLAAFVSAALRELKERGGLAQLRRRWNL